MNLLIVILVLSLGVLASNTGLASLNIDNREIQLYNSVVKGDYKNAVHFSESLEKDNLGNVIKSIVNRLISESNRNVVDYAYQLWKKNFQSIVKLQFTAGLQTIIIDDKILIVNKKDAAPMTLAGTLEDEQRLALCVPDNTELNKISWKKSIIDSNQSDSRIYFKFLNLHYDMYLQFPPNGDGDQRAYGTHNVKENKDYNDEWYLQPLQNNLFHIVNRQYNQVLRMGKDANSLGERVVWNYKGVVTACTEFCEWHIII